MRQSYYVVDVNVPIVANGDVTPQADDKCKLEAVEKLDSLMQSGIVVIDDLDEVLKLYTSNSKLVKKSQPNTGFAFLKWILERQADSNFVHRVPLEKNGSGEYVVFPSELKKFDPADRIYVALALAHPKRATILNAIDSDYSENAIGLKKAGVIVNELCPHCI